VEEQSRAYVTRSDCARARAHTERGFGSVNSALGSFLQNTGAHCGSSSSVCPLKRRPLGGRQAFLSITGMASLACLSPSRSLPVHYSYFPIQPHTSKCVQLQADHQLLVEPRRLKEAYLPLLFCSLSSIFISSSATPSFLFSSGFLHLLSLRLVFLLPFFLCPSFPLYAILQRHIFVVPASLVILRIFFPFPSFIPPPRTFFLQVLLDPASDVSLGSNSRST
jgi:hypothetical protein